MCKKLSYLLLASALLLSSGLHAELRVADIFQDQMVLQREMEVPVWGWADPGATVRVSFDGKTVDAKANADGYWLAAFAPLSANAKGQTLVVESGSDKISLNDVLVGEVWVASGQSNMRHGGPDEDTGVYPHYQSPEGASQVPIRVISYGWGASLEPMADTDVAGRGRNKWEPSEGDDHHVGTSLSVYFSRVLRDELKVPIGIILVAHSGTNQAAWMSKETLETFPGAGDNENYYEEFLATNQAKLKKNKKAPYDTWEAFKAAEDAWRVDQNGRWPGTGLIYVNFPSALYNTRIFPLAPFAFRGVIWHQGEGGPNGPYGARLVAMFKEWRVLFGNDFPVVWGTLTRNTAQTTPPIDPAVDEFYRSLTNKEIRKAKELFAEDGADFVEFYDVGDQDTHFGQKGEAGRRMALGALNVAYDQENVFTGPRLSDSKVDGGTAFLRFDYVGEGLTYEPSVEGISGFYLLNSAGDTRWANVEQVDGTTLKVSHPDIKDIAILAYGASANPHETVFNSAGLPASPFVINPKGQRLSKDKSTRQVVEVVDGQKVALSLNHVRRQGYVFNVLKGRKAKNATSAQIQAYVPAEWSGVEVLVNGSKVDVESVQNDLGKFVIIDAPADSSMVIVAEAGQGDTFKGVNRY